MSKPKYSVYLIKCNDGSLYTGISKNVEEIIKTHNEGQGAKYTKFRRPVKLKYLEEGFSHGNAIKREVEIKKMKKSQKLALFKGRKIKCF